MPYVNIVKGPSCSGVDKESEKGKALSTVQEMAEQLLLATPSTVPDSKEKEFYISMHCVKDTVCATAMDSSGALLFCTFCVNFQERTVKIESCVLAEDLRGSGIFPYALKILFSTAKKTGYTAKLDASGSRAAYALTATGLLPHSASVKDPVPLVKELSGADSRSLRALQRSIPYGQAVLAYLHYVASALQEQPSKSVLFRQVVQTVLHYYSTDPEQVLDYLFRTAVLFRPQLLQASFTVQASSQATQQWERVERVFGLENELSPVEVFFEPSKEFPTEVSIVAVLLASRLRKNISAKGTAVVDWHEDGFSFLVKSPSGRRLAYGKVEVSNDTVYLRHLVVSKSARAKKVLPVVLAGLLRAGKESQAQRIVLAPARGVASWRTAGVLPPPTKSRQARRVLERVAPQVNWRVFFDSPAPLSGNVVSFLLSVAQVLPQKVAVLAERISAVLYNDYETVKAVAEASKSIKKELSTLVQGGEVRVDSEGQQRYIAQWAEGKKALHVQDDIRPSALLRIPRQAPKVETPKSGGVPFEIYSNTVAYATDISRMEQSVADEVRSRLQVLAADIKSQLDEIDPVAAKTPTQRQERLEKVLAATKRMVSGSYSGIESSLLLQLSELAQVSATVALSDINTAVGIELASVSLSPQLLREVATRPLVQGQVLGKWLSMQDQALQKRLEQEVKTSILQGETTRQLTERIRGRYTGKRTSYRTPSGELRYVSVYAGGVVGVAARDAEAVARTALHTVLQSVRQQTYQENADVVKAVQALAVLDSRTSVICQSRSGMTWYLDGEAMAGTPYTFPGPPPWHFRCRTTLVPVLYSINELRERAGLERKKEFEEDIPKSTQASMDGQVPEEWTYEDWLKTKPKDFQVDVLGPTKWRMWREGRLQFKDMVDQSGNPLTVKQLAEKNFPTSKGKAPGGKLMSTADTAQVPSTTFSSTTKNLPAASGVKEMEGSFGQFLSTDDGLRSMSYFLATDAKFSLNKTSADEPFFQAGLKGGKYLVDLDEVFSKYDLGTANALTRHELAHAFNYALGATLGGGTLRKFPSSFFAAALQKDLSSLKSPVSGKVSKAAQARYESLPRPKTSASKDFALHVRETGRILADKSSSGQSITQLAQRISETPAGLSPAGAEGVSRGLSWISAGVFAEDLAAVQKGLRLVQKHYVSSFGGHQSMASDFLGAATGNIVPGGHATSYFLSSPRLYSGKGRPYSIAGTSSYYTSLHLEEAFASHIALKYGEFPEVYKILQGLFPSTSNGFSRLVQVGGAVLAQRRRLGVDYKTRPFLSGQDIVFAPPSSLVKKMTMEEVRQLGFLEMLKASPARVSQAPQWIQEAVVATRLSNVETRIFYRRILEALEGKSGQYQKSQVRKVLGITE